MTESEAKNFLIGISYKLGNMAIEYLTEKDGEKMREAIKALEPCDDCISREAVLDLCDSTDPEYKVVHFKEDVECLPSVKQVPCDDEYIKVPKKALKYRTAGMVAYNAEWLKNHFDIERAVILGCEYKEQEPKMGHWIGIDEEPHEVWECDHCSFVIDGSGCIDPYDYRDTYKYCPNCGAKMVEPQESEE